MRDGNNNVADAASRRSWTKKLIRNSDEEVIRIAGIFRNTYYKMVILK